MPSLPSVAVVILNWNGKAFLERFLPSVIASSYSNFKIIVADNASTDDSVNFLQKQYPEIRIIKNNVNEGFAKGYNTALQQVQSEYYVLLNSDVAVTAGWIEPVIELMESDRSVAACQPKLLNEASRNKFEYAGAAGGWIDVLWYPFARGRVFEFCETDNGQYDKAEQIFWATGAALFVWAEAFHSVGGFDEYFFAHQEEIDLCWRLQLAGYKIYAEPRSVVYHIGGGSLPVGDRKKVYLNFRNNLILLTKNLPRSQAFWKIPVRIALDNIAALKGLFSGHTIMFTSIVKAHFHYLGWLFGKKEKKFHATKKGRKPYGIYSGSVIWKYFIQGKKIFSQIVKNKE